MGFYTQGLLVWLDESPAALFIFILLTLITAHFLGQQSHVKTSYCKENVLHTRDKGKPTHRVHMVDTLKKQYKHFKKHI